MKLDTISNLRYSVIMTVYQQSRRSSADRVVYKGYLRSDIVSTVIIYTMAMVRRSSSHRYLESDIVSTVIINLMDWRSSSNRVS